MGGYGSGFNGYRKTTTGEVLSLDMKRMNIKRTVAFNGSVEWKNGSSIGIIKPNESELILNYSITLNGAQKQYSYSVELDYMACNYGGERVWFVCPECDKRARIIYLKNGLFRCRTCQSLNYSLQQEDWRDYTIRSIDHKIYKLQYQLKTQRDINNTFFVPKPKGMHYNTYEKLMKKLRDLHKERDNTFVSILTSYKIGMFKDITRGLP